jgi:hypothetical protein
MRHWTLGLHKTLESFAVNAQPVAPSVGLNSTRADRNVTACTQLRVACPRSPPSAGYDDTRRWSLPLSRQLLPEMIFDVVA